MSQKDFERVITLIANAKKEARKRKLLSCIEGVVLLVAFACVASFLSFILLADIQSSRGHPKILFMGEK